MSARPRDGSAGQAGGGGLVDKLAGGFLWCVSVCALRPRWRWLRLYGIQIQMLNYE